MHVGNYLLVLHSHLPWVLHHGDWPHGSDWLCEAVAESYIPLLNAFNELMEEGIRPGVTIGLSPVLCEQMEHPDFAPLFMAYCDEKIQAARADYRHFEASEGEEHLKPLANFWEQWYSQRKKDFSERYKRSVVTAFRRLQDAGALEIMTCGATHGYLPLLAEDRSVELQMCAARANYRKHFGLQPRGTWIPECAYRPAYDWHSYLPVAPYESARYRDGVEQVLHRQGINYFFVDQHAFEGAEPLGVVDREGNFTSVYSERFKAYPWNFDRRPLHAFQVRSRGQKAEHAAVFARHRDIAMQVWSGEMGYPGDPDYLDFHKKYYRSSLRYWRVTDSKADMAHKQPYVPQWTRAKLDLNAHHFIQTVEATLRHYREQTGQTGLVCTMFDTELFGHWWFEGPTFLKAVLRGLHYSPYVQTQTASENLAQTPPTEVVVLPESSWGDGGHHDVWINEHTKWLWHAVYRSEAQFNAFVEAHPPAELDTLSRRILRQALRELMLMQASDWEFLITTFSAKDYAERRFQCHHSDFCRLMVMLDAGLKDGELSDADHTFLEETERRNAVFAELQSEWWLNGGAGSGDEFPDA